MCQIHLNFFSDKQKNMETTYHIQNMQYMAILDKVEFDVPGGNVWSNIDKKTKSIRYIEFFL